MVIKKKDWMFICI